MLTREEKRLAERRGKELFPWYKWGAYVSERSWGTVREDYSASGDAWTFFPFEEAHSRSYRWGDDGIAGWCDRYQVLLLAFAFWNGKDPILKERLFGLSCPEGNHGEDVKECYYYLDATPTHSYMKYLYRYPHAAFPYQKLKEENAKRTAREPEFELVQTGVFDEGRFFDIQIEYAKDSPEGVCIRLEVWNRSHEEAPLHILPHLWFRNQWAWQEARREQPKIVQHLDGKEGVCLLADDAVLRSPSSLAFDYHLGRRYFYGPKGAEAHFTDNESVGSGQPYTKDAFHRHIIGKENTVNPHKEGTKACLHYLCTIPPHSSLQLHFRLTDKPYTRALQSVEKCVGQRREEADRFYETLHPPNASEEERRVQRQALAGMLWNKQIYLFDVNEWLKGDNPKAPPPNSRLHVRNMHWRHLNSMRILSMPDKWEFPWFAAWDLAFHTVSLGLVDLEFAKEQLLLLLFDQFQHPNGAIPSHEWDFSELNPPIQAWAALRLYQMEAQRTGKGDREFLVRCLLKLLMNFAFWVNKVDSDGLNVFEGGFLGLDNITLIDRSLLVEGGAVLRQSDGTGWMAKFCLDLMRIALHLAKENRSYETLATKFFEHFVYIAHAMKRRGNQQYEMWSGKDGFFYDVLSYPDGTFDKFRVRSLVGIIPLYAVDILEPAELEQLPDFRRDVLWFLQNRPHLTQDCVIEHEGRLLLTLVKEEQLRSILRYVWDPEEFRSPFGMRSLSKVHQKAPFFYQGKEISYEPGESTSRIKGGNSNWRGPIWMPTSFLLVEALQTFGAFFGERFSLQVQGCPAVSLSQIAHHFAQSAISLFLPGPSGARPVFGEAFPFANDPLWRDHLQFYEYYHAETGQGLGASHQTGWSGLVANFIDEFRRR